MQRIAALYDRSTGFLLALGEIVVAVMCLHIVAEIVANLFRAPIEGTPEIIARWYMVAIVFLPLGALQRRGEHISADLFTSKVGPRGQAVLDVAINLAMAAMAVTLAWYTAGEAWDATARRERIELVSGAIPTWPFRWLVPLGFTTLGLTSLLLIPARMMGRSERTGS